MKKLFILLCCLLAGPLSAEPISKEELNGLIRDYIINNPETLIEAMTAYQTKQQQAGVEEARKAVAKYTDEIYNKKTDPAIGGKSADITIVEFYDYNCGACKFMFKALDEVYQEEGDNIRIIFKEFPIFGDKSQKLAKVGLAFNALAPEKYYDFHRALMTHKGSVEVAQAYDYAKELGVTQEALEKELSSSKYATLLDEAAVLGDNLQIRGTPFLIIDGELVPHAVDAKELRKKIAAARAE